jgi:hypothetical protein
MKTITLLCALTLNAFATQPVLVRVTPETLAKLQQRDPMIRLVDASGREIQTTNPLSHTTMDQSSVLHDGTHWTLVPKGALIHLPEAIKNRSNVKPVGTLLPWKDFLAKNQRWIATSEVTFDQAVGNEALPADRAESLAHKDKVVVAVHRNDPASVQVAAELPSLTSR